MENTYTKFKDLLLVDKSIREENGYSLYDCYRIVGYTKEINGDVILEKGESGNLIVYKIAFNKNKDNTKPLTSKNSWHN